MSELTAFDPNALKKKVAEHIQNTFSALIPDDVFASMVDKAIKEFFEDRHLLQVSQLNDGYNNRQNRFRSEVNCTMFEALVYEMIFKLMQEEVTKFLKEQEDKLREAIAAQIKGQMASIDGSITANLHAFVLQQTNLQINFAASQAYQQAVTKVGEAFRQAGQWDIASRILP